MKFKGRRSPQALPQTELVWALGSLCALHRRPFAADMLAREFPPPCTHATLVLAGRALGLRIQPVKLVLGHLERMAFPLLVGLHTEPAAEGAAPSLGMVTAVHEGQVLLFRAGSPQPERLEAQAFVARCSGEAWCEVPEREALVDTEAAATAPSPAGTATPFGFTWFVPELLRHRHVWRDVLLASLVLQLIALATPLFTQAIVDKVAIGVAMLLFTVFSSLLTWVRQYLVLHTGNRVDAVLGAAVWAHLLKLPVRYFQHRPTGVVAARLQGVETIREFVSGSAVSLLLDLPFLVICLGVMLWYSVPLTAVSLALLAVIALVSVVMAPLLQSRLNTQFLLGARNQAFITEHIGGFETVKSLQMEPQLRQRYGDYLASYLQSGFRTRQIGNTYTVFANGMDQLQSMLILMLGAYTVMTQPQFTIGMLVAFQMFASKLSQPVLRIVGLWSQFQQASLSVQRLGDVMNAPVEPYRLIPQRPASGPGRIEIEGLAFRYADDLPLLYDNLNLVLEPGRSVALMGASGAGKSTLAKLLMGFYAPTQGRIRIDGVDLRHLAANELRGYLGVVPQETVLFSGTVFDNLRAGHPAASFDQVVQASRMAGIHTTIESLPKGYHTEIGERGAGLSGGQKQRLAIARALLKGPKVLIFDEATSALDADTAESFVRTINGLRGGVTMLFITHALPRALKVDEVIHLGKSARPGVGAVNSAVPQGGVPAPTPAWPS